MSFSFIRRSADKGDDGFDLIQPSLIQQLRSILDQYPDDGQILKVKHTNRQNCREVKFPSFYLLYSKVLEISRYSPSVNRYNT